MKRILLLLLIVQAVAAYPIFFYNNEVDLRNNVAYANANPYDGFDAQDFSNPDGYECFSLDDYNYYASQNPADGVNPLTAKNIDNDEFDRLRYGDQLRIINENEDDSWDENDVDDHDDMDCWKLKDYNQYASTSSSDRWDEIHFRDTDDLDELNKVGVRRFGFADPDDFYEADLYERRPQYRDSYGYYG